MKKLFLVSMMFVATMGACKPAEVPPPRDEVRGALYAIEWAFQQADKACAAIADDDIEKANFTAAKDTAGACSDALDAAKPDMAADFEDLANWTPDSAKHVECRAGSSVAAMVVLKKALLQRGVELPEVNDGELRAQWLLSKCSVK